MRSRRGKGEEERGVGKGRKEEGRTPSYKIKIKNQNFPKGKKSNNLLRKKTSYISIRSQDFLLCSTCLYFSQMPPSSLHSHVHHQGVGFGTLVIHAGQEPGKILHSRWILSFFFLFLFLLPFLPSIDTVFKGHLSHPFHFLSLKIQTTILHTPLLQSDLFFCDSLQKLLPSIFFALTFFLHV